VVPRNPSYNLLTTLRRKVLLIFAGKKINRGELITNLRYWNACSNHAHLLRGRGCPRLVMGLALLDDYVTLSVFCLREEGWVMGEVLQVGKD
jgi:hypothetical protein